MADASEESWHVGFWWPVCTCIYNKPHIQARPARPEARDDYVLTLLHIQRLARSLAS